MSWAGVGIFVVSTGVGLWQGDKAKKEADKKYKAEQAAYNQAQAAAQAAAVAEAKRIAHQEAANKILNDANSKSQKAKTTRTVLIISVIGGTVLTAATIIGLTLRKK